MEPDEMKIIQIPEISAIYFGLLQSGLTLRTSWKPEICARFPHFTAICFVFGDDSESIQLGFGIIAKCLTAESV